MRCFIISFAKDRFVLLVPKLELGNENTIKSQNPYAKGYFCYRQEKFTAISLIDRENQQGYCWVFPGNPVSIAVLIGVTMFSVMLCSQL
jgi:hypothetical protein